MAERDIISFKDGKMISTPRTAPVTPPKAQEAPKKVKPRAKPQLPDKDAE